MNGINNMNKQDHGRTLMERRIKLRAICKGCEKTEHIAVNLDHWKFYNEGVVPLTFAFPDLEAQKRELVKASTRGHVYFCADCWPEDPDYPDYVIGGDNADL
jgi:hypothetical protein